MFASESNPPGTNGQKGQHAGNASAKPPKKQTRENVITMDDADSGDDCSETTVLRCVPKGHKHEQSSMEHEEGLEHDKPSNLPDLLTWLEQPVTRTTLLFAFLSLLLVIYTTLTPSSHNRYAEGYLQCQLELQAARTELSKFHAAATATAPASEPAARLQSLTNLGK